MNEDLIELDLSKSLPREAFKSNLIGKVDFAIPLQNAKGVSELLVLFNKCGETDVNTLPKEIATLYRYTATDKPVRKMLLTPSIVDIETGTVTGVSLGIHGKKLDIEDLTTWLRIIISPEPDDVKWTVPFTLRRPAGNEPLAIAGVIEVSKSISRILMLDSLYKLFTTFEEQ